MLPFLKKKQAPAAGIIVKTRQPDEKPESEENQDDSNAAHEACARDLLSAIERKDVKGIAAALYDAFTVMESEPHDEGPHTNDYDEQNEEAAEDQE